ncbi:type II toxin-antitoxin system RelE/ParE family toxin [Candidatus Saccharibacteria bacterium]|nr:type II toxin-antitoxin system RelE/ParE family toxin [Candidatus Saccharibacteria bacterium]
MIVYQVEFKVTFIKSLRKISSVDRTRIEKWIVKNLHDTANPRAQGKALTGNLNGLWRYRVGKYRIIAQIRDAELILLMIDVANRGQVYRNR